MSRRSLNNYMNSKKIALKFEKILHQRMNVILGNSKAVANQLINIEGAPKNKVGLIYNGKHNNKSELTKYDKAEPKYKHYLDVEIFLEDFHKKLISDKQIRFFDESVGTNVFNSRYKGY